jgi:hypothetical protein
MQRDDLKQKSLDRRTHGHAARSEKEGGETKASESGETPMMPASHHTRQGTCFTMGWFAGQANACWNSGIFTTSPLTR